MGSTEDGAARRQPAGNERDDDEHESYGGKGERVVRGDAEELRAHQAGKPECQHNAEGHTDQSHGCSLTENEAENVTALCAEGHADADFARALADQIRDDAVDADAGKPQRDARRRRRAESWRGVARQRRFR